MTERNAPQSLAALLPAPVLAALSRLAEERAGRVWFTGGAVRDWLRGMAPRDLDITVEADAAGFAKALASACGGTLVPLDEGWDIHRVVIAGMDIDVSSFREGAATIGEELGKRDFTVNAMALPFAGDGRPDLVLDPQGGRADLAAGVVRAISRESLEADPLRLLRAYRFAATLGFAIAPETVALIRPQVAGIARVAVERVAAELDLLMASGRAADAIRAMADSGLLWHILPELREGCGVEQPASHHLDVFGHSLAALAHMERILARPEVFFPESSAVLADYLAQAKRRRWLVWAALLHDLGKPATRAIRGGRITFHQHDQQGAQIFTALAGRLRWSKEATREAGRFIAHHMWPFHLGNVRRTKGAVTPRACLKLVKTMDEEFPGLFLVAMADSLAGEGPGKPAGTEANVAALFCQMEEIYHQRILPVTSVPRLLSGHDLKERFGLAPGPRFRSILDGLEEAQVAGEVATREEAEAWVARLLAGQEKEEVTGGEAPPAVRPRR